MPLAIIEAIPWNAVAVPVGAAAIFAIAYTVATKIAEKKIAVEKRDLESKLKSETEQHAAARATIHSMQLQKATDTGTIDSERRRYQDLYSRYREGKSGQLKLFKAADRVLKEHTALREQLLDQKKLQQDLDTLQGKVEAFEGDLLSRDEKLQLLQDDLAVREAEIAATERRLKRARKLGGYLIKAKALQSRPKFKPLSDRKRAIIAVAALKGGVGKTTVTAHLAGALARKGYRVLALDIDLQGSLTGLMLPPETIRERFRQKRLLQDFLLRAADDKSHRLTDYIVPSPYCEDCAGSIHIVPTSDMLAYAELNLTLNWLLKKKERDARFLLRKALHLIGPNAAYDIVLIDCPPVINMSCANALAAADFLLIPTLLSMKSVERVPNLVRAVQAEHFQRHVNSQLRVLGVVANRVYRSPPQGQEAVNWETLPNLLQAIQQQRVKRFTTVIASAAEISSKEEAYTHPKAGGKVHEMLTQFALEFEEELPHECRRTA